MFVATSNTQFDPDFELTPVQIMVASVPVLAKEWDTPEEDEIWEDL